MTTSKEAPRWVMTGLLILCLLSAVSGIFSFLGVLPSELISFSNEYGERVTLAFSFISCFILILYIVYFTTVAVFSIRKDWNKIVLVSALLLIVANVILLIDAIRVTWITNMQEARNYMDSSLICGLIATCLNVAGTLILTWCVRVSKAVKVTFSILTVFFGLMVIPGIYLSVIQIYPYLLLAESMVLWALTVMSTLNSTMSWTKADMPKERKVSIIVQIVAAIALAAIAIIFISENQLTTHYAHPDTELHEGFECDGNIEDSAEAAPQEVISMETVHDPSLLGLTGPVESVVYKREGSDEPYLTAKFDENGAVIASADIKIFRDDRNRITKYEQYVAPDSENNYEYTFSYNGDDCKPSRYCYGSYGSNSINNIAYGNDGTISKVELEADYEGEENTYEISRTYTILARDSHGNWTRRRVEEETIENYTIENALGEYSPRQHVENETYTETRTIKYHDK